MALLIGPKKVKTAVFISGKGSNLKSLIKFSRLKKSPISIDIIISNNSNSKGLSFSKVFKIKKKVINFKIKHLAEREVLDHLNIDHGEVMDLFANILCRVKGTAWKAVGVDCDGLDLMRNFKLIRVIFKRRVFDPGKVREELVSLAAEARKNAKK